jgi:starvation-inducible DNA-binding protein
VAAKLLPWAGMSNKSAVLVAETSKENAADSPLMQLLQKQVANAFVIYSNYKHYHWQVTGPLFRDLHLMFDEFAQAVLATQDEFAERIRMIGQDPIFSPQQVMDTASVEVSTVGRSLREMIQEADNNSLVVIREMRRGAKLAEEADDPGTVDLFSRMVQIHEKQEWWLRDILEKDGGLATR